MFRSAQIKITLLNVNSSILSLSILFFISFAKKKPNKQTERKNIGRDTATAVANNNTVGPDTNKKLEKRNIKKHSNTKKTTATYNKLLNEKRDRHYYILTDRLH